VLSGDYGMSLELYIVSIKTVAINLARMKERVPQTRRALSAFAVLRRMGARPAFAGRWRL